MIKSEGGRGAECGWSSVSAETLTPPSPVTNLFFALQAWTGG